MIEVQDNVATCKLSHIDAVEKLGKNCHYPGSFQGAVLAYITHSSSENRFAETLRDVIKAGGCNCSRANYAGALLGAEKGEELQRKFFEDIGGWPLILDQ